MNSLSQLLYTLCKPNPSAYKDDAEREIVFKNNKNVFGLLSWTISSICSYLILSNQPIDLTTKLWIISTMFHLLVFATFCRSYLFIFQCYFFLMNTIIGPSLCYFQVEAIYFSIPFACISIVWSLYLNGTKACIFQTFMQVMYLHLIYKDVIINILMDVNIDYFAQRIVNTATMGVAFLTYIILRLRNEVIQAQEQIAESKLRNADLERQKTSLLSFSHEIRNLINAMTGSVHLCLSETVPHKVRDLLNNSEVCSEVLLHLVNNILDTGKIELGEIEINPTPNVLIDSFEKIWGLCSQLIKNKGLTCEMSFQKHLPQQVMIDHHRLMQIMMNLVGNAIKFTDKGSINIDVKWIENKDEVTEQCFEPLPFDDTDEGLFEKSQKLRSLNKDLKCVKLHKNIICNQEASTPTYTKEGILKVIVSDSGCGIPSEKLPLLFSKFGQVGSDLSKRELGTGLGLFITKQLVEKMNGSIKVFSKPREGTVFIVCIPVKPLSTKL